MDKNNAQITLRVGVVGLLATVAVAFALSFFSDKLLPVELHQWKEAQEVGFMAFAVFGLAILGLGLLLISLIGLLFLQRWAAWLLLVVCLVFNFLSLVEPTVEPGIMAFLGSGEDLLTGAVLAVAFFTSALKKDA
jgi:hypothetical protein